MTERKRKNLLMIALGVMLAGLAWWNVGWMLDRRADARAARRDLAICNRLAGEIDSLRSQPTVASTEAMGVQQLGKRIEFASQQAGLSDALRQVNPQPPKPLGDSPYLQKNTLLSLRGVTLQQLVTFVYHLTDEPGFKVTDLRLRSPHGASGRTWDAEVTVVYLIYEPSAAGRRRR